MQADNPRKIRHPVLPVVLIIAMTCISTAAILIKLCNEVPPLIIATGRLTIASIILIPVAFLIRGKKQLIPSRKRIPNILLAAFFLAAHFVFWIISLKHTSVMSSVVIVTTNPIFVGIASYFLFKEAISKRVILAILIAAIGGLLIAISDTQHNGGSLFGDVMALGGAAMASGYFLAGRHARKEMHFLDYITPVYATAALILLGACLITNQSFTDFAPRNWIWITLMALFPQLLGHSSINWALGYATATLIAIVVLSEPIGSSILAFFILHERFTFLQLAGAGLILMGIFLAVRKQSE